MRRSSTSLARQASLRIKHGTVHADTADRQRLKIHRHVPMQAKRASSHGTPPVMQTIPEAECVILVKRKD